MACQKLECKQHIVVNIYLIAWVSGNYQRQSFVGYKALTHTIMSRYRTIHIGVFASSFSFCTSARVFPLVQCELSYRLMSHDYSVTKG